MSTDWDQVARAHGMDRTDLYRPHGTDKAEHGYMAHYQQVLAGRDVRSLLEIGVQSGASLAVWAELFPDARLAGIDIDQDCGALDLPFETAIGRADELTEAFPDETFDVIIDDGSHLASDTAANLAVWAPRLSPGGVYVIEDAVIGSTSWVQSLDAVLGMLLGVGLTPFAFHRSRMPWVAHQHYGGMMSIVFADAACEIPGHES